MYSIRWCDGYKQYNLVGDMQSVLALANILENKKQDFRVGSVITGPVSQVMMGVGGFSHWL